MGEYWYTRRVNTDSLFYLEKYDLETIKYLEDEDIIIGVQKQISHIKNNKSISTNAIRFIIGSMESLFTLHELENNIFGHSPEGTNIHGYLNFYHGFFRFFLKEKYPEIEKEYFFPIIAIGEKIKINNEYYAIVDREINRFWGDSDTLSQRFSLGINIMKILPLTKQMLKDLEEISDEEKLDIIKRNFNEIIKYVYLDIEEHRNHKCSPACVINYLNSGDFNSFIDVTKYIINYLHNIDENELVIWEQHF